MNLTGTALTVAVWAAVAFAGLSVLHALGVSLLWEPQMVYLSLIIATVLVTRFHDGMPMAWTGLGVNRRSPRELVTGLAFGLGMAAVAWAPLALGGHVRGEASFSWGTLVWPGVYILTASLGEEVVGRGYLYQRVIEIFGTTLATISVAALFALAHLGNPSVSAFGLLNTFIAGVFFALCYLRTGSLWMSFGAHAGWNLAVAQLFGLPMSGVDYGGSLLRTTVAGSGLITGGAYGPEGGAAGTLALALGIVLLLSERLVRYGPQTYAAVFWARHARRPQA